MDGMPYNTRVMVVERCVERAGGTHTPEGLRAHHLIRELLAIMCEVHVVVPRRAWHSIHPTAHAIAPRTARKAPGWHIRSVVQ